MSSRQNNPTNTNTDRNAYWYEMAGDACDALATFLSGKARKATFEGMRLDLPAPVFGQNESTTLTRKQARSVAITFLSHRVGRADSNHMPSNKKALNECGDRALAGYLRETSVFKNVEKHITVRAMSGYNGEGPRYEAQIMASGNAYTVKGDSTPYHSRKQAVKVAARKHFADEWKSANEINCQETRNAIKAQVIADGFVSLNGVVITPPQKRTPAPKAQQSSAKATGPSKAVLLARAQGIGVTGTSKMNKQQLADAISERLSALGL